MKTTIDGIEYKISFNHYNPPKPERANTQCSIEWETGHYLGSAIVHPKDTYCKETGRKLALRRALLAGGFSREQRKLFWAAYRYRRAAPLAASDPWADFFPKPPDAGRAGV